MNRPSAIFAALLLAAGLLGIGLWGGAEVLAQMKSGAKDAKSAKEIDLDVQQGILAKLTDRPEAVVGRTARGQTIEDAPPFEATERIEYLEYHPCSDCHEGEIANRKVRELEDEHTELGFQHGGGRLWCYDACHNPGNMDNLRSARGEPISFDESYKLCGECHFKQQKDWYFGAHGKRAGSFEEPREIPLAHSDFDWSDREKIAEWKGERLLHNCTDCHNAHSPAIKPYEPSPPPQVRARLSRKVPVRHERAPIWKELASDGEKPAHGGK